MSVLRCRRVNVFGFPVPVTWSRRRPAWAPPDARMGYMEWRAGRGYRIWINTAQAPEEQRTTLIHEILHVIAWAKKIDLGDDLAEEATLLRLEAGIDDVLRENPAILKAYLGD